MNALTNKMQLIARRGKIHFSACDGYSAQWREWWGIKAGRIVDGKRRRYDHVAVGMSLDEVMGDSCPLEFFVSHFAYECRGWRSYGVGPFMKREYLTFALHLPPW